MHPINYTAYTQAKNELRNYAIKVFLVVMAMYSMIIMFVHFTNTHYIHSDFLNILIFLLGFAAFILALRIILLIVAKKNYLLLQKSREEFAKSNGFQYSQNISADCLDSLRITKGESRGEVLSASNLITYKDELVSFSFFDVTATELRRMVTRAPIIVGTSLVFYLSKSVPNIYIVNKKYSNLPGLSFLGQPDELIKLNVDLVYENDHTVYVRSGEEIEALQLLDSNLITELNKYSSIHDIEFINSYMMIHMPPLLNISWSSVTNSQNKFEEALALGKSLGPILTKQMKAFSFTPQGYVTKKLESTPINRVVNYAVILLIIVSCIASFVYYMLGKFGLL